MREIKFKLWVDSKVVGFEKWYPGSGDAARPQWLYGVDGKYWNPKYIFHNKKDHFIGLKDKNGVEMYEGDIVKTPNGLSVISYDPPRFVASNEYDDCFVGFSGEWEVVGTIYENPELLKESIQERVYTIDWEA